MYPKNCSPRKHSASQKSFIALTYWTLFSEVSFQPGRFPTTIFIMGIFAVLLLGVIEINRAHYQATGTAGIFPLEDEINLPQRGYSYFLQEISSKLAVNGSYEKACEVFADIFPVTIPIRSLERIVGDACEDAARYYEEKPAPELPPDAVVTVATLDKKGVVIRNPPSKRHRWTRDMLTRISPARRR